MLTIILFLFLQTSIERDALIDVKLKLENLHYTSNLTELMQVRAQCERLLKLEAKNFYVNFYLGLTYDEIATVTMSKEQNEADEIFDKAIEYFEKAQLIKKEAEIPAYLSSIYGKKINLSPLKAMYLGPKSANLIDNALASDPNNPRILIFHAISKMFTPSFFGGDKDLSRKQLEKAIILAENYVEKDGLLPSWGKIDAYVWIAQLDKLEEKQEEFTKHIAKALELRPDYGFANYLKNKN